ncbi:hypothetical protein EV685_0079 [Sphaerotilus mobilis]|uniref:Uncharacterized protein n=1 Tax=Sphaerotilus mobilis TaxID=47994 RepID=A0A4Q7LVV3_9BURK|nr:hypothetical protein EV685_0079 [Sphaerotilus mobilis]
MPISREVNEERRPAVRPAGRPGRRSCSGGFRLQASDHRAPEQATHLMTAGTAGLAELRQGRPPGRGETQDAVRRLDAKRNGPTELSEGTPGVHGEGLLCSGCGRSRPACELTQFHQADVWFGRQGWPERQQCEVLLTYRVPGSGRHRRNQVNDRQVSMKPAAAQSSRQHTRQRGYPRAARQRRLGLTIPEDSPHSGNHLMANNHMTLAGSSRCKIESDRRVSITPCLDRVRSLT